MLCVCVCAALFCLRWLQPSDVQIVDLDLCSVHFSGIAPIKLDRRMYEEGGSYKNE